MEVVSFEKEHWKLNFFKNDWFQKGSNIVAVHLYVKDVTSCNVKFSEDCVNVVFCTSNDHFLHVYGPKTDDVKDTVFAYSIHTSGKIISEECSFTVCKTRIELKLTKLIPDRWVSLETRKAVSDRKQGHNFTTTVFGEANFVHNKTEKTDNAESFVDVKDSQNSLVKGEVPSLESQSGSCNLAQQRSGNTLGHSWSSENMALLGGKSTPFSKKSGEQEKKTEKDAVAITESQAGAVAREVYLHKNLNKTMSFGLTGLENYANNCYMNVVIQVLANIQEIRDYFVDDHFLNSIIVNNPMSSGGRVAKAFAEVIKDLWSSERKSAVRPHSLKPLFIEKSKDRSTIHQEILDRGKGIFQVCYWKHIMGKRCNLFMGFQQCDAQEFFATLLDNLHEDMNQGARTGECNEIVSKEDDRLSSSEKADTSWYEHFKRNDSLIVKMFHGQMVSKLTCQACHKVSTTYEACAQISLPIVMSKHKLQASVFFRSYSRQPERIQLQISTPHAQIWHLLNIVERHIGIPANRLRVFQDGFGFCQDSHGSYHVTFDENAPLTSLKNTQKIVICEVKDDKESDYISLPFRQHLMNLAKMSKCANCNKSQNELDSKLKRCTRCMYVAYCCRDCQGKHWGTHQRDCRKGMKDSIGLPFFVTIHKRKLSFETLSTAARQFTGFSVNSMEKENDFSEVESDEKIRLSNSDAVAGWSQPTPIPSQADLDEKKQCLKLEGNSNAAAKTSDNTMKTKETEKDEKNRYSKVEGASPVGIDDFVIKAYFKPDQDPVVVSSDDFKIECVLSATYLAIEWQNNQIKEKDSKDLNASLKHTQACLSDDESLLYDQCSIEDCFSLFMEPERLHEKEGWKCPKCKTAQDVKKEMALSYPPPILLVHFKRFTYAAYGQKVAKCINYPISGLDLSCYVAEETRTLLPFLPVYDLTGVICHKGSMGIGHYTCMVRSLSKQGQTDIGWRYFDDDSVSKIGNDRVLDSSAYVLVYRMRSTTQALTFENPFPILQEKDKEWKQEKSYTVTKVANRQLSFESGMKNYNKSLSMDNSTSNDHARPETRKNETGTVENNSRPSEESISCNLDLESLNISEAEPSLPLLGSDNHRSLPETVSLQCSQMNYKTSISQEPSDEGKKKISEGQRQANSKGISSEDSRTVETEPLNECVDKSKCIVVNDLNDGGIKTVPTLETSMKEHVTDNEKQRQGQTLFTDLESCEEHIQRYNECQEHKVFSTTFDAVDVSDVTEFDID